ncbi:MAG: indolepyruvate ferredoxin oxidoreductase subunit beta [Candidatus Methanoliparum thermophilum]|uniref:Indolepyruvate ferredoxin oxidoreductase subunit beta n=1 Tax=Methanoliparum thermophilum TaxID=2491083 RepID=A0A520KS23_METT2|nr:indolepyruvate oxidoreductase subunit beta [Candidatus Methanoliparum sp. LAM-1]RZN64579.1 MAG: indolepyruvate ferredoxin oxidoreductase subunit beta [Candidatus Methanoliparum thermophilum]BDC35817.1 indolepyruvate oxidoreductase [Candidatus Methanoliparum sp. LAM-1]
MSFDLLIVGVGGQGTILASRIIGEACIIEKRHVISAETHGMAQRGGSVENHVRIDGTMGPLIPIGGADMILSLEPLETVRYIHYLKNDGLVISNNVRIVPQKSRVLYPPVEKIIRSKVSKPEQAVICNANAIARKAGNELSSNIVLIGIASRYLPLKEESLIECIKRVVPSKATDVNLKAFDLGRRWKIS